MLKKLFLVILSIFLGAAVAPMYAQISCLNLLTTLQDSATNIEESGGQILFMQIDNIELKEEKSIVYKLKAGAKYGIIAVGDNERITNIDLSIADDKAYKVGEDKKTANFARIKVQPKYDGLFVIHVIASNTIEKSKDGFFGLLIVRYPQAEKTRID